MKYIDAERLRKEVKRLGRAARKFALGCADSERRKFFEGKDFAYLYVGILIDSLQQEQPMPDSTKLIELWHEDKEMLKEKDFRNDPWRLAYNAFLCGFGRGIAVNKQELPEVECEDLEEAAKKFVGYDMDCDELRDYEIGIATFKAGAEWQKKQMMKGAVEGFVGVHLHDKRADVTVNTGYLPKEMGIRGDSKVRVIIVKEEG